MVRVVLRSIGGLACALVLGMSAGSAGAATFVEGSLLSGGVKLDLSGAAPCGASGGFASNVGTFSGSGPDGSGTASCGVRSSPQAKTPTTPNPYGRFDPEGIAWVDSNDLTHVAWTVDVGNAVKAVSFLLSDAHDQPNSFFRLTAEGSVWSIAEREANGTGHLLTILFDNPVLNPVLTFETRHNDGWGVANVRVEPVPVPPALLLAATGAGLLAVAGRRRRRRAAA